MYSWIIHNTKFVLKQFYHKGEYGKYALPVKKILAHQCGSLKPKNITFINIVLRKINYFQYFVKQFEFECIGQVSANIKILEM